jgi:hypothetical protein
MIVIALKQNNGLLIPIEYLKDIFDIDFTQIKLEINILEYTNDSVKATSGIIKSNKVDGKKYQDKIRKEWQNNIF